MRAVAFSLFALALVACGPSPSPAAAGPAAATTGEERSVPTGPPPSFLAEGSRFRVRVDMARIRRSPIAPDLASALASTASYQAWAGSSGLEPIRDMDAVLVGSAGAYSDRRTIVLRYVGDEASIRERILRMAVDHGVAPAWREVQGFAVVDYPDPSLPVLHTLVLTAPHELVLAPADELARILAVAEDHAARRAGDETLEPGLAFGPNEVLSVVSDEPMPTYSGYPAGPERYRVTMVDDADGSRAELSLHGDFPDEASCGAAHDWLVSQRDLYADHMLLRAAQLDRPLRSATFTQSASALDVRLDFTVDELRRALGAMALLQATRAAR